MLAIPPIPTPCPPPVPALIVKDGEVFANSRDVAKAFGKNHADVLKDCRRTADSLSGEISLLWFRSTTYERKVGFGTRRYLAYEMTRDGFVLLVMGYTGPKAMAFKVACQPQMFQ